MSGLIASVVTVCSPNSQPISTGVKADPILRKQRQERVQRPVDDEVERVRDARDQDATFRDDLTDPLNEVLALAALDSPAATPGAVAT